MGEWQCRRLWFPGIASVMVGCLSCHRPRARCAGEYVRSGVGLCVRGQRLRRGRGARVRHVQQSHLEPARYVEALRVRHLDCQYHKRPRRRDRGLAPHRADVRRTKGSVRHAIQRERDPADAPGVEVEYLRGLYSCGEGNEECDSPIPKASSADYKTGWITIGVVEIVLFLVVSRLVTDCRSCGSCNPPRQGEPRSSTRSNARGRLAPRRRGSKW